VTNRPEIDNDIYDRLSDSWWNQNGFLNLLQSATNPWRVPYFRRILAELQIEPAGSRALEIGCGGGLLAEEIARMGFAVTGIDPSRKSLEVANLHARESGLQIDYRYGFGGNLPFDAGTFDVVFCCDVLEHIRNWDEVIGESARVLRPHGIFFYNTVNRTRSSKLDAIKMMQEWWPTRFAPPNTHVWEMFVAPQELEASAAKHGLSNQEVVGTRHLRSALEIILAIWSYKSARITSAEFGRRIRAVEGPDISVNYMGYAIKSG
jgi:2-polyprenyl-6-hydroxyphenyl methylase/3-demethylubiquinone-9 3-methyltransferase